MSFDMNKTKYIQNLIFIPSVLFFFLFFNCSINRSYQSLSSILGTWTWVKSVGGIAGHTITPESPGYSKRTLIIDENYVTLFQDNEMLFRSTYEIRRTEDVRISLFYHDGNNSIVQDVKLKIGPQDTLILTDKCVDCYTHVYVRK